MSGATALLITTPGVVLVAAVAGVRLRSAFHLVGTATALTVLAAAGQLPFGLTTAMAAAHVVLFAVALAAAAFGYACRAWFRDPLDATGMTLGGAALACGGLLAIGQLASTLPVSLLNAALLLNPIVAVAAAADIDLVRTGRLYDLLPIAHGTFTYPRSATTVLVYLILGAMGLVFGRRAQRPLAALLMTILATAAAAAPVHAGARADLSVQAGLNGIVRPGRWVPVTVTVTTGPSDITGRLIVEWGSARAFREVSLAAPSTRRFEFFLRTGDVRDRIGVRLEAAGATPALADTAVTVIDAEDVVTLCIGDAQSGSRCTLTLPAADVPTSYRALDGVDAIVGRDSATGRSREVIQRWAALRRLEITGNSAPAAGALPSTGAAPHPASRGLWYAAAMLLLGGATPLWRRRPLTAYAVLVSTVGAGVAIALMLGTRMPVTIRHASVAESFVGVSGSAVSTHVAIALPGTPGTLTVADPEATAPDRSITGDVDDERFDESGALVLARGGRLGQTVGTRIAAWTPSNVLAGTATPSGVRVTNVSSEPLSDCLLPAGFSPARVDTLAAGSSIDGQPDGTEVDPVAVCRSNTFPLALHYPGTSIEARGTTSLVLHLSSDAAR